MEWNALAGIAAVISVGVLIFDRFFGGGWSLGTKIGDLETRLHKAGAEMEGRIKISLDNTKREIEERQDDIATAFADRQDRSTGAFEETLRGLREKINKVELDGERTFMRRDDHKEIYGQLRQDIKDNFDEIKKSIARMESKIDQNGKHE